MSAAATFFLVPHSMRRLIFLLVLVVFLTATLIVERLDLFDLDTLQSHHQALLEGFEKDPVPAYLLFSALLVFLVSFSIPGTLVCMLFAGSAFELTVAVGLVVLCRTLGGAVAFLGARYIARDWVEQRFGRSLRKLDAGVRKEGWMYLLILRLAPVLPDSVINPGMGLTVIGLGTFMVVSLLGMIPYVVLYALAGQQLGQLASAGDVVDLRWLVALSLIALAVLGSRKVWEQRLGRSSSP